MPLEVPVAITLTTPGRWIIHIPPYPSILIISYLNYARLPTSPSTVHTHQSTNNMSDNKDTKKPADPPKKDSKPTDDKRKESDKSKDGYSLDWLVEATNYEPKPQPPKKTDDWMADGGKIV